MNDLIFLPDKFVLWVDSELLNTVIKKGSWPKTVTIYSALNFFAGNFFPLCSFSFTEEEWEKFLFRKKKNKSTHLSKKFLEIVYSQFFKILSSTFHLKFLDVIDNKQRWILYKIHFVISLKKKKWTL